MAFLFFACFAVGEAAPLPPMLDEPTAEERVLRRFLLAEAAASASRVTQTAAASATLEHPTGLLVRGSKIYASEFRRNRVLVASNARAAAKRSAASSWRVFAERGPHCDKADCALLDGPWGLAATAKELFVASFGSDQILCFDRRSRRFLRSLGSSDSLDSPEGLALRGGALYAASFLDSRIVQFDLEEEGEASPEETTLSPRARGGGVVGVGVVGVRGKTIAAGDPVDVDVEAGVFVDANAEIVEARRKLWGLPEESRTTRVPVLKGPEQLVATNKGSLLVSSLHNSSVLELHASSGRLLRADLGSVANGPLGIALVEDPLSAALFRQRAGLAPSNTDDLLLVASYRDDDVLAVDFHFDDSTSTTGGGHLQARSLGLQRNNIHKRVSQDDDDDDDDENDRSLRGPAALSLDSRDPGGLYVACYESGEVLYFNLSATDDTPLQNTLVANPPL